MVPIVEYQRLQLGIAIFIIVAAIAAGLVYRFIWKNKDQQETIEGLSCRVKELNTQNLSMSVRIKHLKKLNNKLNSRLALSTHQAKTLRIQLHAATKLLEEKDKTLTEKTWLIIDMQNDFYMFDAGYKQLQEDYARVTGGPPPSF